MDIKLENAHLIEKKTMAISPADLAELKEAKKRLEGRSFFEKVISKLGLPLEKGMEYLPAVFRDEISRVTSKALEKALDWTIATLDEKSDTSSPLTHSVAAALTGGVSGFFGMAAFPVELPLSTMVMLRSIADIARSYGEDLSNPETRLNCLQVFALGKKAPCDDAMDLSYFALRMGLATEVSQAAAYITQSGLSAKGSPLLVKLIAKIAARFEAQVSAKIAASAVPIIGAAGGAIINTLFIDHFQTLSRGHFCVRKMERLYGADAVKAAYVEL